MLFISTLFLLNIHHCTPAFWRLDIFFISANCLFNVLLASLVWRLMSGWAQTRGDEGKKQRRPANVTGLIKSLSGGKRRRESHRCRLQHQAHGSDWASPIKSDKFFRACFRVPIMSPCRAETLLSRSTLSERSEDGDYGSDWATDGPWLSVSRMGSEGHYGAFTMKSLTPGSRVLLASDVRSEKINTVVRLLIEFALLFFFELRWKNQPEVHQ